MATPAVRQDDRAKLQAGAVPREHDWTKPHAMAIPKEGYFKAKQELGRYGSATPQCHSGNRMIQYPHLTCSVDLYSEGINYLP
jgi:hypothetical protein